MVGQIEFIGKKSYDDFKFLIDDINIGNPSPNIILDSVPYQNGVYDFSEMSGDMTYSTREIKLRFKVEEYLYTQAKSNVLYYKITNWLSGKSGEMKISWIEGLFSARCISVSDMSLLEDERVIEVAFLCQPFRNLGIETDTLWDTFNFETDYMQVLEYVIEGTKKLNIYNINTVKPSPSITCSSSMNILFNGNSYILSPGINTNVIKLDKGLNVIEVTGSGSIKFEWEREVI